jgi:hypothetical protein
MPWGTTLFDQLRTVHRMSSNSIAVPLGKLESDSNKAAITNNYPLSPSPFSDDGLAACLMDAQDSVDGPESTKTQIL